MWLNDIFVIYLFNFFLIKKSEFCEIQQFKLSIIIPIEIIQFIKIV